jgi:hypothetical protein
VQAAPFRFASLSVLGKSDSYRMSHSLLSNGQKDEECDARNDAMKNYSWYPNDIFYLPNQYNNTNHIPD